MFVTGTGGDGSYADLQSKADSSHRDAVIADIGFAAAHLVHVGLIVWLGIASGQVPLHGWILWFFLVALFFAYLLTQGRGMAERKHWPRVRRGQHAFCPTG